MYDYYIIRIIIKFIFHVLVRRQRVFNSGNVQFLQNSTESEERKSLIESVLTGYLGTPDTCSVKLKTL